MTNQAYETQADKLATLSAPSDMCHAIAQAVARMKQELTLDEIADMVKYDQSTLTAEYRPQMTADLEAIYNSLDDHSKGVLQDRLDDMWIAYCLARYPSAKEK